MPRASLHTRGFRGAVSNRLITRGHQTSNNQDAPSAGTLKTVHYDTRRVDYLLAFDLGIRCHLAVILRRVRTVPSSRTFREIHIKTLIFWFEGSGACLACTCYMARDPHSGTHRRRPNLLQHGTDHPPDVHERVWVHLLPRCDVQSLAALLRDATDIRSAHYCTRSRRPSHLPRNASTAASVASNLST